MIVQVGKTNFDGRDGAVLLHGCFPMTATVGKANSDDQDGAVLLHGYCPITVTVGKLNFDGRVFGEIAPAKLCC